MDSRDNRKPTPRQAPTRRRPAGSGHSADGARPAAERRPSASSSLPRRAASQSPDAFRPEAEHGPASAQRPSAARRPGADHRPDAAKRPSVRQSPVPKKPLDGISNAIANAKSIPASDIPALARQHTPAVLLAALVALVIFIAVSASFCANHAATNNAASDSQGNQSNGAAAQAQPATVHFVAVGDNLPENQIGAYADAQAGEVGDGVYDYTSLYEHVKPYIESADLAYVKEETHIGGDEIGPLGYPSYNTTDEMADALVATGFDFVASASNHAYDWGAYGANEHSCELWKTKDVAFTGTADSEEDAQKIATVERNGITFALLDYTYGLNGYEQSDVPSYAVNFIDKDRIASDVARAREQADVVLVAMHWGTENYMDIDDEQAEYAQYLADLGVDVVLGSHPHVIGPMQWVEGKDGNKTLVAYSLGNFITRHDYPLASNDLEGMLSCDFVRNAEGKVSVENVVWTPLVNHTDGETFRVYALKDYTNELAAQNPTLADLEDPIAYLKQLTRETVGENFAFDD